MVNKKYYKIIPEDAAAERTLLSFLHNTYGLKVYSYEQKQSDQILSHPTENQMQREEQEEREQPMEKLDYSWGMDR